MDETMVQTKEKFIGVLVQFYLLSVSKKQKIAIKLTTQMTKERERQQRQTKESIYITRPRDKSTKGLGVSLAKTPFKQI